MIKIMKYLGVVTVLFLGMVTGHFNYSNIKTGLMSFYRENLMNSIQKIHTLMSYLQL